MWTLIIKASKALEISDCVLNIQVPAMKGMRVEPFFLVCHRLGFCLMREKAGDLFCEAKMEVDECLIM